MTTSNYSRREFLGVAFKGWVLCSLGGGLAFLSGCADLGPSGIEGESIVITDSLMREVELPKDPDRIAAIDSFAGEYLVIIGAGPRLVTIQYGTQSAELLRLVAPNIAKLQPAMLSGAINVETLLSKNADVAVVAPGTYQNKPQADKLKSVRIPVAALGFTDIDTQLEAMKALGELAGLDSKERSDELVAYYQDIISYIEKRVSQIPENERLRVYHANSGPLSTDGALSVGSDWIARCGGINVSSDKQNVAGQRSYETSVEQVYLWDPDVIICSEGLTAEAFRYAASWRGLRAVKEKRVYNIPIGATRWGQHGSVETYLGMLWFVSTFYPKYFPDLDLKEEVLSYYSHFMGLEISDELYEQILSSRGLRKEAFLSNGITTKENVA